jgi:hypothetical protein
VADKVLLSVFFFEERKKEQRVMNIVEKEGAWCWFADPRAVCIDGKTFAGSIDVHGNITATMIEKGVKTSVLVRSNFQPDDHDNPTFFKLPDGRIMIIYSRHTDEACFYYRISKMKGDITELGEEKKIETNHNTTYPSLFMMENDDEHMYLFYRGVNWHPTCAVLTVPDENDDVSFVKEPFQIVKSSIQGAGCRPYAKYVSDKKGRVHFVYSATHPDNLCPVCIYYSCLDVESFTLYDAEGNVLKKNVDKEPFEVTGYEKDPAFVVDNSEESQRGWVWDIALHDGEISAATVRISEDKKSQKYYYTYYSQGEWKKVFLADAKKFHSSDIEYCYGGGMSLDKEKKGVIYASVPIDNVFEIIKYTFDERSLKSEAVTEKSELNNVRPYKVSGGNLMWMSGDYYYWIVNSQFPKGFPTSIMYDGEPLCEKYSDGETVTCSKESHGIIYEDEDDVLEVHDFDVYLNGVKSENLLSTSDWNREHIGTTDGSVKCERPNETEFLIISEGEKTVLLRNGKVDICVERGDL